MAPPTSWIPGCRWFRPPAHQQALSEACTKPGVNPSLVLAKYPAWSVFGPYANLDIKKKEQYELAVKARTNLTTDAYQRLRARKNSLPCSHTFTLRTQSRVAVNLGNPSILENTLALHPLFGFPVLPGSAIKGATRHYLEEADSPPEGWTEEALHQVFGHPHDATARGFALQEGDVIFLDGWPLNFAPSQNLGQYLEVALMNPHFGDYYRGIDWPADNQKTNPIHFLVIKRGIAFQFALSLSRSGRVRLGDQAQATLTTMQQWVTAALCNNGLGAKTGSGYGYFIP